MLLNAFVGLSYAFGGKFEQIWTTSFVPNLTVEIHFQASIKRYHNLVVKMHFLGLIDACKDIFRPGRSV